MEPYAEAAFVRPECHMHDGQGEGICMYTQSYMSKIHWEIQIDRYSVKWGQIHKSIESNSLGRGADVMVCFRPH